MNAKPRYATARTPHLPNRVREIGNIAVQIGMPLLPWVKLGLETATEYEPDTGEPHRRAVLWTVPRQSGKSVGVASVLIEAGLRVPDLAGVYVAQTRSAGTKRLKQIGKYLKASGLDTGAKVTLGVGNERIRFSNGSEIYVESPSADSVHGDSLDIAVLDELFAIDPILLTAVTPAMAARPKAQLWMISTAGTLADSELLNERRDTGRENPDGEMAFLEYSIDEDDSPYDMEALRRSHPGLGYTTTEKHLISERSILSMGQYLRAYGNISTAQESDAIPVEWWERSRAIHPVPRDLALAVDITPDGSAIAGAFLVGDGWHTDVIEHRAGAPGWLIPRLKELMKFRPNSITLDSSGPANSYRPELQTLTEDEGIPLLQRTQKQRSNGDMWFLDRLRLQEITHNTLEPLEEAVKKVGTETDGTLWRFGRKRAIVDVSPLLAASLAAFSAYEIEEQSTAPSIVWA